MKSRRSKRSDQYALMVDELGCMLIQPLQARRAFHRLTAALAARTEE